MDKPLSSLSRKIWINQALQKLTTEGIDKVSIAALARDLSVTKGSFYWHFKDITDFEVSLLKRWSELTTENTIQDLNTVESSQLRLLTLVQRAMEGNMKLERAIRSWAISDSSVAKVVQGVDFQRVKYIESILQSMNVDSVDVMPRARMLYWASLGHMMLPENHNVDLIIVPGVVFDEKCGRCGRGSGYYDKYLDRIKALNVTTIALAHDLQILPHNYELTNDRWDVSMDVIITEKRIITPKGMIWYD